MSLLISALLQVVTRFPYPIQTIRTGATQTAVASYEAYVATYTAWLNSTPPAPWPWPSATPTPGPLMACAMASESRAYLPMAIVRRRR